MSRLGFKRNKQEGMILFFLFLPDGSGAGYFQEKKVKDYTVSLHVAGMKHSYIKDGKRNYQFKGNMIFVNNSEDLPEVRDDPNLIAGVKKVEINLDFSAINEEYEYSKYMTAESLELGKKAGDKHWEQIAIISGELEIGDKKYSIQNTMGQRDHTYGIRDWTGVGNWFYYVVWFNDRLAINPAVIISEDGRCSTGGFLFKEGKNIPIKTIKILNQEFREDGIFPISSKLELIDYNENLHVLNEKVGSIIPVPFKDNEGNQSILIQSIGDFELDGIKGGYGTFETWRKINDK